MYNLNCVKICARYNSKLPHYLTASLSPSRHLSRLPRGDITSWTCGSTLGPCPINVHLNVRIGVSAAAPFDVQAGFTGGPSESTAL